MAAHGPERRSSWNALAPSTTVGHYVGEVAIAKTGGWPRVRRFTMTGPAAVATREEEAGAIYGWGGPSTQPLVDATSRADYTAEPHRYRLHHRDRSLSIPGPMPAAQGSPGHLFRVVPAEYARGRRIPTTPAGRVPVRTHFLFRTMSPSDSVGNVQDIATRRRPLLRLMPRRTDCSGCRWRVPYRRSIVVQFPRRDQSSAETCGFRVIHGIVVGPVRECVCRADNPDP
jgi:hypothetical protein